jgi:YVTN family beta-propeller protein
VSGDSVTAITPVGRSPINALVEAALAVTADRDSDSVTTFLTTLVSTPSTTGLPSGARPTSLVNANGTIYVTESGRNVVAVLGGSASAISAEVPVGVNPVNLTVLPNGKKIYVVNRGDNSVTVIDTSDKSVVTTLSDPLASTPVWAVPSADSSHVYVVNQGSSNVTVINATNDSVIANLAVGTSPNYAVFDTQNQRVVITNPAAGSISVINADATSPLFNTVKTITVGTNPMSVTALADGTRLYVANTGSNSVSVINGLSLTVTKTIPVGTSPVSIASDAESAKVFTANRDSFDVSIINTSTDSEVTDLTGAVVRIQAPQIDPNCVSVQGGTQCPKLNPIFVAVGPG